MVLKVTKPNAKKINTEDDWLEWWLTWLGFPGSNLRPGFICHRVLDHFSSTSMKYVLYFIIITFIQFFIEQKFGLVQ